MKRSIFRRENRNEEIDDYRISEFSDTDTECSMENRSISFNNNDTVKENRDFLNTTESGFYTPMAKRFKCIAVNPTPLKCRQTLASSLSNQKNSNCSTPKTTESTTKHNQNEEEIMQIEWSSDDDTLNSTNPMGTQQQHIQDPSLTELDLFLSLIARENRRISDNTNNKKKINNTQNDVKVKNYFKRCRRGGYLHQLRKSLQYAKTDRRYLKHDKKLGIRVGVQLEVLKLGKSFSVNIATVRTHENDIFHIALDAETATNLQIGHQLEAFFDDNIEPYEIIESNVKRFVFLQPSKVISC